MRSRVLLALVTATTLALAGLLGAPAAQAEPAPLAPVPLEANTLLDTGGFHRCVTGFNLNGPTAGYFTLAHECAEFGTVVHGPGNVPIGPVTTGDFSPTGGYVLVRVDNTEHWQQVGRIRNQSGVPVVITGSGETPVGGQVCISGSVGGYRCGTVTAKNVTVAFPEGTLTGLTRTNLCLEGAEEAGAPVFTGSQAQGIMIGGAGGGGYCTSFFRPINQIMAEHGLTLITG